MFICFPHYIMGLTGDARVVTADAVVGVSKLKGLNSFAFGSNLNFRIALRNKEPTQSAWCVCVCVYTSCRLTLPSCLGQMWFVCFPLHSLQAWRRLWSDQRPYQLSPEHLSWEVMTTTGEDYQSLTQTVHSKRRAD